MKLRKLIALVLTGIMLVMTLTACSSDKKEPTTNNTTETGNEAQEPTKEAEGDAAGQEPIKVVVWNQIFEEWNQKFFEEKAAEYNELGRRLCG